MNRHDFRVYVKNGKGGDEEKVVIVTDVFDRHEAMRIAAYRSGFDDPFVCGCEELT